MTESADVAFDPETDAEHAAVVLRIGGGRYALAMSAVAEVGRPPVLTRVPGVPSWSAGVANWRGRILAVLDLRRLLGNESGSAFGGSRLVVASHEGITLGLLTDGVDGVITVPGDLDPPPVTLTDPAAALIAGQVLDAQGPIAVLNVAAVFRLRDSLPRVRRG